MYLGHIWLKSDCTGVFAIQNKPESQDIWWLGIQLRQIELKLWDLTAAFQIHIFLHGATILSDLKFLNNFQGH